MKVLLFVVFLASVLALCQAQDVDSDAGDKTANIQTAMYMVIRQMALPGAEENITQRFVLSIPGKVLNYADYYPGDAYIEAMKSVSDNEKQFVDVPPKIMQNMFRLADVVPGVDPMRGGDTGQSFVDLYEHVLNNLDVRGFMSKSFEAQQRYRQAIRFLSEPIPDPEDLQHMVARLDLYRRLQRRYNQKRRDAEKTIAEKRNELGSLDYQFWFQRNFPVLYSEVEGAYTEWLVYGQKDLVELYKAHIDTESQGVELEEARMVLRSSGFTSLDRSQTVYPVAFEPSNWYEALVPKVVGPTRDEIMIQLGDLRARKVMLEMIRDGVSSEEGESLIDDLKQKVSEKEGIVKDKMEDVQRTRATCLAERRTRHTGAGCQDYREAQNSANKAASEQGQVEAELDNAEFLMGTSEKSRNALQRQIGGIDARIGQLQSRLDSAPAAAAEVSEDSEGKQTDMDASWLEFEFDTSKSKEVQSQYHSRYSARGESEASGRERTGWWHRRRQSWSSQSSYGHESSYQAMSQELNSAECRVKAKLLKVTIKRPWFKSSLFKSKVFLTRDHAKVSPGPMPEFDFIREISLNSYNLPEYATAFLLAKDVELEFRGVSSSTVSSATAYSSNGKFHYGYGSFTTSAESGASAGASYVATQATTDGLKIRIPGAQIIGYYLHVVPRFPITSQY